MRPAVRRMVGCVFAAALAMAPAGFAIAQTIVFAAASTTEAVTEIGAAFAAKKLGTIVPSFDSSSTLAKQIENGAPAGVFLSADEQWMDYLDKKNLIAPGTRSDVLGNALVLIAPKADKPARIEIGPGFPLVKMLGDGRLSVGDPAHVPAGIYAKAALEALGVWGDVKDRLAAAENVRAALAFVERGETPLGIVYSTDAAASAKVSVVGVFPEDSHPRICYPVGLVAGHDTPEARAFLEFLKGPEARAIFAKYGFQAP